VSGADDGDGDGPSIRALDDATVRQIAAGEVVERPASVVKELVENGLDADASRVRVAVEAGGTDGVVVRDDGVGMTSEEVRLAVREHTTSKIRDVDDIESGVATLGFRGEALHTIGAVSKLTLRSKARGATGAGTELRVEGGEVVDVSPVGCPAGTTVEVADLFYNTPARRKFLKTEATEFDHVNTVVTQYALANPDVSVGLDHDGREVFATEGRGSLRSTVLSVYGREVAEAMVPVEWTPERGPIERVHGLVSHPETTRADRSYCSTFVNGRYVTARTLREAVLNAYGGQLAPDRYPFAVLFVEVPGGAVDVNVHPRKMEVRFDDEAAVRGTVERAVGEALLDEGLVRSSAPRGQSAPAETPVSPGADADPGDGPGGDDGGQVPEADEVGETDGTGEVDGTNGTDEADEASEADGTGETDETDEADGTDEAGETRETRETDGTTGTNETDEAGETRETDGTDGTTGSTARSGGADAADAAADARTGPPPSVAGDDAATAGAGSGADGRDPGGAASTLDGLARPDEATDRGAPSTGDDAAGADAGAGDPHGAVDDARDTTGDPDGRPHDAGRIRGPTSQRDLTGARAGVEEAQSFERLPGLRVLGQLGDTYVVCETDDGLVLVDQHAADERVNYERLRAEFDGDTPTQALASPVELELTAREAALFEEYRDPLARLGFYAGRTGERTAEVRSVPAVFDESLDPDLLRDVLSAFVAEGTDAEATVDAVADDLLADLACYPSVTGNTSLTEGSVVELLEALDGCTNPFACPHGRPTVVRFDADEIAARFERDYPGHAGRREEQ
jgi:DNA mismatch repair protein MutL